jgi:hypothetical protein
VHRSHPQSNQKKGLSRATVDRLSAYSLPIPYPQHLTVSP